MNADEAVVALMARNILHGHFSAFYWGQSYGGGEPYVVAVVFRIFGQSPFTLGLTPVILDAVAALLVFALARRLFSTAVGVVAALLLWIWPEAMLWQSTIEYGFRFATLDCGLGASVIALRVAAGGEIPGESTTPRPAPARRRRLDLATMGLLLGLGFWCSPEIAYFAIPIAFVLGFRLIRRRLRLGVGEVVLAAAAMAAGALPWIWANLRSNFSSFHPATQPHPQFSEHFQVFQRHALPIALGLQLHGAGAWIGGATFGRIAELIAVAGAVLFLAWCLLERKAGFLVVFCVAFPLLYAFWPFTWYWSDGRYVLYLPPMLAILLAASAAEVLRDLPMLARTRFKRECLAFPVIVVLALALTLVGAYRLGPFHPDHVAGTPAATWTSVQSNPNDFEVTLADDLKAAGATQVFAGYWLAYPLTFVSGGSVTATDLLFARNPVYMRDVSRAAHPAWVFADPKTSGFFRLVNITGSTLLDPGCALPGTRCLTAPEFEALLLREVIAYRVVVLGASGVAVVLPSRKIDLARVIKYLEEAPSRR
jgi:4-amino-4-deoxy-L-arabinose transferase-like glycosyltransferase